MPDSLRSLPCAELTMLISSLAILWVWISVCRSIGSSQTGYFNNLHPDGGRDCGTFEGTAGGTMTVEGTFKFTGGDGQYRGITGGGTFKTVAKSETEIEATWNGAYELAKAQAG